MNQGITAFTGTGNDTVIRTAPTEPTALTTQAPGTADNASGIEVCTPSRTVYPAACLPGLPEELMRAILFKLPAMDILRLGLVCKDLEIHTVSFQRLVENEDSERHPEGHRAQFRQIASAALDTACKTLYKTLKWPMEGIDPRAPDPHAQVKARKKAALAKATQTASSLSRRFDELVVRLNAHFPHQLGPALLQADSRAHLNLAGRKSHAWALFLWNLFAQKAAPDRPPIKLHIDTYGLKGGKGIAKTVAYLKDLPQCPVPVRLCSVEVSTEMLRAGFDEVITANKHIEQLYLFIWVLHFDKGAELLDSLAAHQDLRVLRLEFDEVPMGDLQSLIEKTKALKLHTFSLVMSGAIAFAGSLGGLLTPVMRNLEFEGLDLQAGALAGFGEALAAGAMMESLVFTRCWFRDQSELKQLISGVAQSTSLSHLGLDLGIRQKDREIAEDCMTAVQACKSLKTLVLSADFNHRFPDAVAYLRAARPDLDITVLAWTVMQDIEPSSGTDDEFSGDAGDEQVAYSDSEPGDPESKTAEADTSDEDSAMSNSEHED